MKTSNLHKTGEKNVHISTRMLNLFYAIPEFCLLKTIRQQFFVRMECETASPLNIKVNIPITFFYYQQNFKLSNVFFFCKQEKKTTKNLNNVNMQAVVTVMGILVIFLNWMKISSSGWKKLTRKIRKKNVF